MALSDLFHKPAPAELKAAGVTPVRMGIIGGVTDWAATLEKIRRDEEAAAPLLAAKIAERDSHLVGAVQGDKTAAAEADKCEREISELQHMAEWRRRAAETCGRHLAAEAEARAKAETAERWTLTDAEAAEREADASLADDLGKRYTEVIARIVSRGLTMHRTAPIPDRRSMHDTAVSVQSTEDAIRVALKALGVKWAISHISEVTNPRTVSEAIRAQHAEFFKARGDQ